MQNNKKRPKTIYKRLFEYFRRNVKIGEENGVRNTIKTIKDFCKKERLHLNKEILILYSDFRLLYCFQIKEKDELYSIALFEASGPFFLRTNSYALFKCDLKKQPIELALVGRVYSIDEDTRTKTEKLLKNSIMGMGYEYTDCHQTKDELTQQEQKELFFNTLKSIKSTRKMFIQCIEIGRKGNLKVVHEYEKVPAVQIREQDSSSEEAIQGIAFSKVRDLRLN